MIRFFKFDLNVEEMFVGACIQYPFYFIVGWWVLLLMALSGLLWAIGGSKEGKKIVRRLGCAVLPTVFCLAISTNYWPFIVSSLIGFGVISIGYGTPSGADPGSFLAAIYYRVCRDYRALNFAVRLTTYMLFWSGFAVMIPLIK